MFFLTEEDKSKRAELDVINFLRGSKKFNTSEVNRFISLIQTYGQAKFAEGYANAEFDEAEKE